LCKFNPQEFVDKQVAEIRRTVGRNRALIAVSGGVDSSTCAVLTHRALGENLLCVMLDDAFMRKGEPERVRDLLAQPPINLPLGILGVQERFLKALKGLRDAEEKRKAFRETFYKTLSETAKKEGCRFLVQGTIKADIVETVGGIKTQHNVLSQVGISPTEFYGFQVVEPLVTLYKGQVREVARFLGIPSEISERQTLVKHQPSQYFAAIIDDAEAQGHPRCSHIREIAAGFFEIPSERVAVKVFEDRATGIRGGERHYGQIVAIKASTAAGFIYQPSMSSLVALQTEILRENPSFTRVLYAVQEEQARRPYVIVIRAIQTDDFLTAEVSDISWTTLKETARRIFQTCSNISSVYYDVTPKPPATIEME